MKTMIVFDEDVKLTNVEGQERKQFAGTRFRTCELEGSQWVLRDFVGRLWFCDFADLPEMFRVEQVEFPWEVGK